MKVTTMVTREIVIEGENCQNSIFVECSGGEIKTTVIDMPDGNSTANPCKVLRFLWDNPKARKELMNALDTAIPKTETQIEGE